MGNNILSFFVFFVFPLYALTGIGMLIKRTGISSLKKHNEAEKDQIEAVRLGVLSSASYSIASSSSIIQSGWEMHTIHLFIITKQSVDALSPGIKNEIDTLTGIFKKAFITAYGSINNGNGEV